jgi:hypothetical protein
MVPYDTQEYCNCACAVAAVHEGYVLQKSVVRAPLGGALLTRCMQTSIEAKGTEIVPGYSVKRIDKLTGQTEVRRLPCCSSGGKEA